MLGQRLSALVIAGAVIAGGSQVGKSICHFVDANPRALYLLAQYKFATGDKTAALKLLNRSSAAASTKVTQSVSTFTHKGACPYATM